MKQFNPIYFVVLLPASMLMALTIWGYLEYPPQFVMFGIGLVFFLNVRMISSSGLTTHEALFIVLFFFAIGFFALPDLFPGKNPETYYPGAGIVMNLLSALLYAYRGGSKQ